MFPIIEIGSIDLSTYWLFYTIGAILIGMLSYHRMLKRDISSQTSTWAALLIISGGIIGSVWLKDIAIAFQRFFIGEKSGFDDGAGFLGGLIGGIGVAFLVFRWRKVPVGIAFDAWAVPIPLGQVFFRMGCLLAGCCYGLPTESWLGMYLPDHHGVWMERYPTQLISSFVNLLIFLILLFFERFWERKTGVRVLFPGFIFLSYVTMYSTKRFVLDFFRGDALPALFGPINVTRMICLSCVLLSLSIIFYNLRKNTKAQYSLIELVQNE